MHTFQPSLSESVGNYSTSCMKCFSSLNIILTLRIQKPCREAHSMMSIETGETRETADLNLCCNSFETKYISSDSDPNQMQNCRSCASITESHSPPVHPFEYHGGKAMESICTSHSSGGGCFSEAHAGSGKRWFEASDQ